MIFSRTWTDTENLKTMKNIFLTAMAVSLAFVCAAHGGDLDGVKESMRARKDAVAKLLATANVGENNAGYLQKLESISEAEAKTLADENADRKVVYAGIAKEQKVNAADVGKRRAKQIAENAPAGTMLQDADGTWKKK